MKDKGSAAVKGVVSRRRRSCGGSGQVLHSLSGEHHTPTGRTPSHVPASPRALAKCQHSTSVDHYPPASTCWSWSTNFPDTLEIVRSTAAETVIPVVDKVFSLFGFPEVIKSENRPPFQGHAWKRFLQECGVRHRCITPLWPQANAQAENLNKSLEKSLKAASVKGQPWRPELQRVLRAYRCTPHTTTNFTPHRLMYGRDPRTKLPQLTEHVSGSILHMLWCDIFLGQWRDDWKKWTSSIVWKYFGNIIIMRFLPIASQNIVS